MYSTIFYYAILCYILCTLTVFVVGSSIVFDEIQRTYYAVGLEVDQICYAVGIHGNSLPG